jgi:hypothetical protein
MFVQGSAISRNTMTLLKKAKQSTDLYLIGGKNKEFEKFGGKKENKSRLRFFGRTSFRQETIHLLTSRRQSFDYRECIVDFQP